jgi:hypothetical protein
MGAARIARRRAQTIVAIATVALAALLNSAAPAAHAADAGYQLIQEPDAGYSPIVGPISRAARSIRITIYELTDPAAISALVDAHNRGVDTRVILDAAFHGRNTNTVTFQQLSDAGVGVKWAPDGVIYHQKTITIDDAAAAVGTGNLTPQYYSTSRDAWVLDSNPSTWRPLPRRSTPTTPPPRPGGHPRPPKPRTSSGRRWRVVFSCSTSTRPLTASMSPARNSKTAPCSPPWTKPRAAVCSAGSC